MILYLLPNDDEQRQSQPSAQGIFNEQFQFPVKYLFIFITVNVCDRSIPM